MFHILKYFLHVSKLSLGSYNMFALIKAGFIQGERQFPIIQIFYKLKKLKILSLCYTYLVLSTVIVLYLY